MITRKNLYPLLTLLVNYYTALYVVAGGIFFINCDSASNRIIFVAVWLYLLPPLSCRILITLFGRPEGSVTADSPVFMYWWFLTQLQIIFVRLPFLEEVLRIFPGVYSLWLNMWGGKVSLLSYWSPAVTVTDRFHIHIGKGTILGGGCRIGAHILTVNDDGNQYLTLAPVTIEQNSVIGVHAAIGPGCHVYANETVPAGKILKPFYRWKDGHIQRPLESG